MLIGSSPCRLVPPTLFWHWVQGRCCRSVLPGSAKEHRRLTVHLRAFLPAIPNDLGPKLASSTSTYVRQSLRHRAGLGVVGMKEYFQQKPGQVSGFSSRVRSVRLPVCRGQGTPILQNQSVHVDGEVGLIRSVMALPAAKPHLVRSGVGRSNDLPRLPPLITRPNHFHFPNRSQTNPHDWDF